MEADRRYALFFTPAEGSALHRFGERWLNGEPDAAAALVGGALSPAEAARMTASPRRYGFHATLKAPFPLAPGADEPALRDTLHAFARDVAPVQGPPLELSVLGAFVAFRPAGACQDIDRLAAALVDRFDRFRAPLSDADRARRRAAGLTANQAALLERWGYPYVFEEFRFHMTLSDAVEAAERNQLIEALGPVAAPLCRDPLVVDGVTLVRQDTRDSRFVPVERVALRKR